MSAVLPSRERALDVGLGVHECFDRFARAALCSEHEGRHAGFARLRIVGLNLLIHVGTGADLP
jgi:hypothetical protein